MHNIIIIILNRWHDRAAYTLQVTHNIICLLLGTVPTAQNDIIIIVYLLIYDGGVVVYIHRTPQLPVLYYRHLLNNSNNIVMIIIIIIVYCNDRRHSRSFDSDRPRWSVGRPKCCCCGGGGGGSRFHFSAGLYPFHTKNYIFSHEREFPPGLRFLAVTFYTIPIYYNVKYLKKKIHVHHRRLVFLPGERAILCIICNLFTRVCGVSVRMPRIRVNNIIPYNII